MGDHVVLDVDPEVTGASTSSKVPEVKVEAPEEEPLISSVECRICQEEDSVKNLDSPCACNGSLKFAHRDCVQRWINEKGDLTCEICHEPYKSGYIAPPRVQPDETAIGISGGWSIARTPLDLHDPRLLAMTAAQRHYLESEYDGYDSTNASGAAFCRSVALILLVLLFLRHALTITNGDEDDDDASAFFSQFLLRAAGFLLPCYIMAWAISILQQRRQREEAAAALATSEVAFILQSGPSRGLQFSIAPDSPDSPATPVLPQHQAPHQEPHQQ